MLLISIASRFVNVANNLTSASDFSTMLLKPKQIIYNFISSRKFRRQGMLKNKFSLATKLPYFFWT